MASDKEEEIRVNEDTCSSTTSYDEKSIDQNKKTLDNDGEINGGMILLNAELSSMIALLRRQMSTARFFSDTGPLVNPLVYISH